MPPPIPGPMAWDVAMPVMLSALYLPLVDAERCGLIANHMYVCCKGWKGNRNVTPNKAIKVYGGPTWHNHPDGLRAPPASFHDNVPMRWKQLPLQTFLSKKINEREDQDDLLSDHPHPPNHALTQPRKRRIRRVYVPFYPTPHGWERVVVVVRLPQHAKVPSSAVAAGHVAGGLHQHVKLVPN
jgi:hypothetical protein